VASLIAGLDLIAAAIDRKNRRLFAGCGGNKKMAVVDADSGNVVASPAIGEGCDATGFDADRGLAFASAGDEIIFNFVRIQGIRSEPCFLPGTKAPVGSRP